LTFLAIMLLPLSVMAMTPVSDQTLSDVTGQAGVNINADLRMDITIGTLAWGDADGITTSYNPGWALTDAGGYVGVTGLNITDLRIKARETDTFGGYSAPAMLKPITIDVATDEDIYDGNTFVRFGLGSLQITMDHMDFTVFLAAPGAPGQRLGVVSIGAMAVYINPVSYLDIYNSRPGNRCGIFLAMNVVIDEFDIDHVSWGDIDGQANTGINECIWMAQGAQSAGYIGLSDLRMGGPITIAGTIAIDVTTSYNGIYSHGRVGVTPGAAPVSVVHIGFPRVFSLSVSGPIVADVKLDRIASLGSINAGTLGNIYISGLSLDVRAGSWVDIWAH